MLWSHPTPTHPFYQFCCVRWRGLICLLNHTSCLCFIPLVFFISHVILQYMLWKHYKVCMEKAKIGIVLLNILYEIFFTMFFTKGYSYKPPCKMYFNNISPTLDTLPPLTKPPFSCSQLFQDYSRIFDISLCSKFAHFSYIFKLLQLVALFLSLFILVAIF